MNENGTDQELSQAVGQELAGFVASLLVLLDEKLDKRLAPLSGRYRPLGTTAQSVWLAAE